MAVIVTLYVSVAIVLKQEMEVVVSAFPAAAGSDEDLTSQVPWPPLERPPIQECAKRKGGAKFAPPFREKL
jgi:hypothetical protein